MKTVEIFGVEIAAITASQFREELIKGKPLKVGKVNTEFLLRAQQNENFRATLGGFDINIADGKGVLWAAKYLSLPLKTKQLRIVNCKLLIIIRAIWQMIYTGASLVFYPRYCQSPIPENIPGVEALYIMLEAAIETERSVYFLGAMEDVNEKAVSNIKKKYPKLKVAGNMGGFWKEGEEVEDIKRSGASLLVVALGSPKQEYWIRDNMGKLPNIRIAVGEGGSLDFIAGSFKRASKWMQRLGLEWFWRLFMNRSLSSTGGRARRVWKAVPVFIYEVVKWKVREGGNNQ